MSTLFASKNKKEGSTATFSNAKEGHVVSGDLQKEISARAQEIFKGRNGNSGDPLSDWLKAEKEIKNKQNS